MGNCNVHIAKYVKIKDTDDEIWSDILGISLDQ